MMAYASQFPESLMLALEDWDNTELDSYDQHEAWKDAVGTYNTEHETLFDAEKAIRVYKQWKRDKYKPDY